MLVTSTVKNTGNDIVSEKDSPDKHLLGDQYTIDCTLQISIVSLSSEYIVSISQTKS